MTRYEVTETLDVRGETCPMPVVETSRTIGQLGDSDVLEVLATDPGSMSDLDGWAASTDGVELLDQVAEGDVYSHYVRKID